MSAIDWTEIAQRCRPLNGSTRRGVLKVSNLGFFAVFVPNTERARVERELGKAGITIHGVSNQINNEGERVFVAVVKADNQEKLRMIAHGLTES